MRYSVWLKEEGKDLAFIYSFRSKEAAEIYIAHSKNLYPKGELVALQE